MNIKIERFGISEYEAYILASMENKNYFSPVNSLIFLTYQLYTKGVILGDKVNFKKLDTLNDYEREFMDFYQNNNIELMYLFCKEKNNVLEELINKGFFQRLNLIESKELKSYAVTYKKTDKYKDFQNEIYLNKKDNTLTSFILIPEVLEKVEKMINEKLVLFESLQKNKNSRWQKI